MSESENNDVYEVVVRDEDGKRIDGVLVRNQNRTEAMLQALRKGPKGSRVSSRQVEKKDDK